MEMESDDLTTASGEGKTEETKDSTTTIISSEPQVIKREKSASISSDVSSTPASPALSDKKKVRDKINVLLKPVGDAPILKQKLWAVDPDKPVSSIIQFTKTYLRLETDQNLFFFVNQAFAPSPDQLIRNLYECFGSDGKLILHYSTTVAWG